MFILIFSLVFLAFAALFTFLGVLKGKKYTWMYSVSRIVCAIVCAILTMALSGLAGNLLGGLLLSLLGGVLPGQIGQLLEEVPSMGIALRALLVAVIAPLLFVPLFAIVYNVANIFVKMILKPLMGVIPHKVTGVATNESASDDAEGMPKKKKRVRNAALRAGGKNPIGALCGGLCGLLLFGIVIRTLDDCFDFLCHIKILPASMPSA